MKLIALLLFSMALCGQERSGPAATKGACSPANTGNNNTFNITCQGISDKLGTQLIELLNRVAKNQADAESILSKLDSCLEGVRQVREQQASRHLTEHQKAVLLAAMSLFKGKRVTITVTEGDPEAFQYAQDFVAVFRKAEFILIAFSGSAPTTGVNPMTMMGGPPATGIVLNPKDAAEWLTPVFESMERALTTAGIRHSAEYIGKMRVKDTDLEFFVGKKPLTE